MYLCMHARTHTPSWRRNVQNGSNAPSDVLKKAPKTGILMESRDWPAKIGDGLPIFSFALLVFQTDMMGGRGGELMRFMNVARRRTEGTALL